MEYTWNSVQSAGQYIMDAVVHAILAGVRAFVTTTFTVVALLMETIVPELQVISTVPLRLAINGVPMDFGIEVTGKGLTITLADRTFLIQNIFANLQDTLGLYDFGNFLEIVNHAAPTEIFYALAIGLLLSAPVTGAQEVALKASAIALFLIMISVLTDSWIHWAAGQNNNARLYANSFHGYAAYTLIVAGIASGYVSVKQQYLIEAGLLLISTVTKIAVMDTINMDHKPNENIVVDSFKAVAEMLGTATSMGLQLLIYRNSEELTKLCWLRGFAIVLGLWHVLVARLLWG